MIKDVLPFIVEGIKLQFNRPTSMRFSDTIRLEGEGFIKFTGYALYEVVGAYLQDNKIIVLVNIYKFSSTEFITEYAMDSFVKKIKSEIIKRIPEAEGNNIDICPIKKFLNENLER
ncbi:MAG: hypothetical protein MUO73_06525 [Thermoplasmata archaeon]|nr:hypothetical protein [Thermoplasmata archaeon]